jgi:hypothetical protein
MSVQCAVEVEVERAGPTASGRQLAAPHLQLGVVALEQVCEEVAQRAQQAAALPPGLIVAAHHRLLQIIQLTAGCCQVGTHLRRRRGKGKVA